MIRTIIFDLGGVLMMHNMPLCIQKFQNILGKNYSKLGLLDNGEGHGLMLQYEQGLISTEQFVDSILSYALPGTTAEQVLDAWDAMHLCIPDDKMQLLDQIRQMRNPAGQPYLIAMLSNNNAEHWRHTTTAYPTLAAHFDQLYLSHLVHMSKPNPEFYRYIIGSLSDECRKCVVHNTDKGSTREPFEYLPEETIFVDDIEANRLVGESFGWQTCDSIESLMKILQA